MMRSKISFYKYSGTGNTFILVDNRLNVLPYPDPVFVSTLCHEKWGIGADGLILLENSSVPQADFAMRIFNSDGGEAEMCGNGIRCLALFARDLGIVEDTATVQTMERVLEVSAQDCLLEASMGKPKDVLWNIPLTLMGQVHILHKINTGVPHVVLFCDDVDDAPVSHLGRLIRNHSFFRPAGTNVNFVEICSSQDIRIRTFERGVEGETLACGTGATAAALTAAINFGLPSPISVHLRSQESLRISFDLNGEDILRVSMAGTARKIFEGTLDLERFSCSKIFS